MELTLFVQGKLDCKLKYGFLQSDWMTVGFPVLFPLPSNSTSTWIFKQRDMKIAIYFSWGPKTVLVLLSRFICVNYYQVRFFFSFGHMEVPMLGVESELQLPAYATATASPSLVCDLHGKARSLTHWARPGIEPTTSRFLVGFVNRCTSTGTPGLYQIKTQSHGVPCGLKSKDLALSVLWPGFHP